MQGADTVTYQGREGQDKWQGKRTHHADHAKAHIHTSKCKSGKTRRMVFAVNKINVKPFHGSFLHAPTPIHRVRSHVTYSELTHY